MPTCATATRFPMLNTLIRSLYVVTVAFVIAEMLIFPQIPIKSILWMNKIKFQKTDPIVADNESDV